MLFSKFPVFALLASIASSSPVKANANSDDVDDTASFNQHAKAAQLNLPFNITENEVEHVYYKREPHSFELRQPEDGSTVSGSFEFRALDGGQSSQYYVQAFLQASGSERKSLFDRTLFDGYVVLKTVSVSDYPSGAYTLIAEESDEAGTISATITRSLTVQGSLQAQVQSESSIPSSTVSSGGSSASSQTASSTPSAAAQQLSEQDIGALKQVLKGLDGIAPP